MRSVEENLENKNAWTAFRELYNHVKSAIHFSAGLRGRFGDSVDFNIETLVNVVRIGEK